LADEGWILAMQEELNHLQRNETLADDVSKEMNFVSEEHHSNKVVLKQNVFNITL